MKKIINEILSLLVHLVETKVDRLRLKALEVLASIIATSLSIVLAFFVVALGVLFSSIALAFYLDTLLESEYLGFLIVGGGYLLMSIVLFLVFRIRKKPMFMNYIIKNISGLIYEEKDKNV